MATRFDPLVELANDIASFTHDPLAYAMYAYGWGQGALANSNGPREWQQEQFEEIRQHLQNPVTRYQPLWLATASGHGIGKSAGLSMICNWALDTCDDTRIIVTANTEAQLLTKTMPEIGKWRRLGITSDWFKPTATALISSVGGHEKSWRLDASPWSENNTEAFAGLHNEGKRIVLVFDEASKIADKVWEVAEGAMTDENTEIIWLVYGNPTRNTGRFRECFGRYRHRWNTRQIDSRTVEGTNKAYLDQIVATYGIDSDITKVRVLGQFPASSSMQFISSDVITAARTRAVDVDPDIEPLVMGVDVARFGDDSSTIYFRRGRDARSITPRRFHGLDTMQLVGHIVELQRLYKATLINIDEGGIGAGVVDRCRQLGLPALGVSFGSKPLGVVQLEGGVKVANRRAEIYAIMRDWLPGGAIPDDQILADDLAGVEYGFNARDEILLESKDHMKARGLASPDDGDGLALTFASPVLPFEHDDGYDDWDQDDGRDADTGY